MGLELLVVKVLHSACMGYLIWPQQVVIKQRIKQKREWSHPALRRRGDVAATSLCMSQWRCRYVSNETLNDVSLERCQDVSVVRLHDVLLERHNNVSKGRNNDAASLRLHDVLNKS